MRIPIELRTFKFKELMSSNNMVGGRGGEEYKDLDFYYYK